MFEFTHCKKGLVVTQLRALLAGLFFLAASLAQAQGIATNIVHPTEPQAQRGHKIIDIAAVTRHPAYLEPKALNTPQGVRILNSVAAPDNLRTCPRGVPAGSECRQVFRVTFDTQPRCHAGGDYEALFQINCWPGTPPSLCKPGIHQFTFKLEAANTCQP